MTDLNTAEIHELPVAEIGPGPLVRTDRLDEAHAELLRPMLDEVPPVVVRETGKGWSLIDGQHRLSAAKLEERQTIRAVVVALDDAEALEAAVKANTSHGKALTLTERKAAADQLLATTDWSDRRIAAACGLHRVTVGKARPDDAGGQKRPRVGSDGKTYDAVNRAKARQQDTPPAEAPTKCTDGFDCPATPGPDGVCDWHRKKRNEAAQIEPEGNPPAPSAPEPGKAGVDSTPDAAATGGTEDDSSPGAGDDGGSDSAPAPPVAAPSLPCDWRERLANACYLIRLDPEQVADSASPDDDADLCALTDWCFRYIQAKEQNT